MVEIVPMIGVQTIGVAIVGERVISMSKAARRRPTPGEWLWYALGGRLSPRLYDWVRRDLTGRTWIARHLCRALAQWAVPALPLLLLLPGPLGLRLGASLMGLIVALYYSASYLQEIRSARLVRHGWPANLGIELKARREAATRQAAAEAYAAAWRVPTS
jgi:hypothetical protein